MDLERVGPVREFFLVQWLERALLICAMSHPELQHNALNAAHSPAPDPERDRKDEN